jgi:hypothetical protein
LIDGGLLARAFEQDIPSLVAGTRNVENRLRRRRVARN